MTDVDEILDAELKRLVPLDARPDWGEVAERAGLPGERRRRWGLALVSVATAVALGVATPLGSAVASGLGDFSAWLTGQPGSPVSEAEQRAFDEANARSWLQFPPGTQLRRLISTRLEGSTVELVGFRAGTSTLCLRVIVNGEHRGQASSCAPLAELRRSHAPVRAIIVDHGIGRGRHVAWYGIDRFRAPALQVTAGIAADGVRRVLLEDEAGLHEVQTESNAFLYAAGAPRVAQRVQKMWAEVDGRRIFVPFARAPSGFGGAAAERPAPPAPEVERRLSNGRIGWLEAGEQRGQSLDVLPQGARRTIFGRFATLPVTRENSNVWFGRVVAPDPGRPARVAVTLNSDRPGGPVAGICTWFLTRGGLISGGCTSYPDVFRRTPITGGFGYHGPSAFMTASGLASDDVARIEARRADGERVAVPLVDNTYIVDLPRASLPARLVAYDANGRVVGVTRAYRDVGLHAAPARGRAQLLWKVEGPNGAHAELFVGRSTTGGECMFVKHFVDRTHAGVMTACEPPRWRGGPLELNGGLSFVSGRVRSDVKVVRMTFADGTSRTVRPKRGYVLVSTPSELVAAVGLDGHGKVVGRLSFPKPGR